MPCLGLVTLARACSSHACLGGPYTTICSKCARTIFHAFLHPTDDTGIGCRVSLLEYLLVYPGGVLRSLSSKSFGGSGYTYTTQHPLPFFKARTCAKPPQYRRMLGLNAVCPRLFYLLVHTRGVLHSLSSLLVSREYTHITQRSLPYY